MYIRARVPNYRPIEGRSGPFFCPVLDTASAAPPVYHSYMYVVMCIGTEPSTALSPKSGVHLNWPTYNSHWEGKAVLCFFVCS